MFIRHYPNILAIVSPATFQNLTPPILEVVLVLVDTCESVLSQVFFSQFKTSLFQFPFKTFKRGHSIYGEQKQKTVQGR